MSETRVKDRMLEQKMILALIAQEMSFGACARSQGQRPEYVFSIISQWSTCSRCYTSTCHLSKYTETQDFKWLLKLQGKVKHFVFVTAYFYKSVFSYIFLMIKYF